MNVYCHFPKNSLTCVLLEHMLDVMLKVRTRSGKHMFREDMYTRTLKYRRWNNELQPFCSLNSLPTGTHVGCDVKSEDKIRQTYV